MNVIRIAAIAAVTLGLATVAQAQTQTGTTDAPSQSNAPAAQPAVPSPTTATKKKPMHLLTPDEIKATFGTGKPFAATSPTGKVIMITLKPDGAATAVPKGSKSGKKGTWRTDAAGYCSTWAKSTEHCYQLRQTARSFDVETASGALVAHWAKP